MRVLVTGASGFVGSHVVHAALDRGHEVVAAMRSRGRAAHLPAGVRLVEADLSDPLSMPRAATQAAPDLAVHLGWSIGPDCYDSPDNLQCVGGSLALLQGLVEANCPRIVFVGTHLELAPSDGDLREDGIVAPHNLYAVSKDALHRIARSYAAGTGASFAWARLFNVYGPGQPDWSLVSSIVSHLLGGRRCPMTHGEQVRTFLHVRDVAEALLEIGQSPVEGAIHVGSDEVVTVRELAQRIGDRLERTELLAFGDRTPSVRDAPRIVPSTARLHSEVGFRPRWSLDDGLADTIEWWRTRLPAAVAT